MRRNLTALALCLLAALPSHAVRRLACGNNGTDTALAMPDGEVVVFDTPGHIRGRKRFEGRLVSIDLARTAPLLAVLRRSGAPGASEGPLVVETWDYGRDQVTAAPLEVAQDARDLRVAWGGHAVYVTAPDGIAVLDLATLQRRRVIAAAGLKPIDLDLAVGPQDRYLAVATRPALWLGRTDDRLRQFAEERLSDKPIPTARFTLDGLTVVAAGNRPPLSMAVGGTRPTRLKLTGAKPSAVFELSSDSRHLYLADGAKVHMFGLQGGKPKYSGNPRLSVVAPLAMATPRKWGHVALLYEDQRVVWYQPMMRKVMETWPSLSAPPVPGGLPPAGGPPPPEPGGPVPDPRATPPAGGLQPPTPGGPTATPPTATPPTPQPPTPAAAPAGPAERYRAVQRLVADRRVFEQTAEPLDLYVLDRDYARLNDVEEAARKGGWQPLILALIGTWMRQPDLVPEPFRPLGKSLGNVDLVELRNVRLQPGVTPARLEEVLGPAKKTETERMTRDGRRYPLYRFGPFSLPRDGDRFPAETALTIEATVIRDWVGG